MMQDIIPVKRKNKKLKIVLIILGIIFLIMLAVTATYFLTKNQTEDTKLSEKVEDVQPELEEEGEFVYVTAKSGLNMRSGASTEHDIIYTLPYRAKLEIEEKSDEEDWYKTTFEEVSGWFSKEYTSEEEPVDLTADWQNLEIAKTFSYSLKYPNSWKEEKLESDNVDFKLTPASGGFTQVYLKVSSKTQAELKSELLDDNHTQAGSMTFSVAGIKGTKIVIQTLNNNKVMYTEDVVFLEKDKKTIMIVGPADGEEDGDNFNLLLWTLEFNEEKNEEV